MSLRSADGLAANGDGLNHHSGELLPVSILATSLLLGTHLVDDDLLAAAESYPGLLRLSAEADHYRWMLVEFRVSLFAQKMRTRLPVSSKRLEQQWLKVRQWIEHNPR